MGRYVRKSIKSSFRGKMKLGGSAIRAGIRPWNSPEDPISFRDYNRSPNHYNKKFKNYYGIEDDAVDTRYIKEEYKQGISYKNGIRDIENPDATFDRENITYITEFISGHFDASDSLSTGHYKLTFKTGQAQTLKTTRPIHYYLNSSEIQYIIDNDIGPGIFNVSTFGDISSPNYGPYLINGASNGETGFLNIIDQSNPSLISGNITGYAGSSDTPTTQILSFYNTGSQRNTVNFKTTGMYNEDIYDISIYSTRKDLQVNSMIEAFKICTNAHSGAIGVTGAFSWNSKENCISWPRYVELRKFVNNVHFFVSGDPEGTTYNALNYNQDFNIYVTGYKDVKDILKMHSYELGGPNYPLHLDCGDSPKLPYNEENHWYLGAPNFFTGHRYYDFNNIKITGNSSIKSFCIDEKTEKSIIWCEEIDLSESSNLGWFFARPGVTFKKLRSLNLSGCAISGQNLGFTEERIGGSGIHEVPSGTYIPGNQHAIDAPVLSYCNLEGNDLNVTGVVHWLKTCILSNYMPNYSGQAEAKVSGYLNIKNQSDPSATFAGFGSETYPNLAMSGIQCLSGMGWVVDFDGYI